MTYKEQTKLTLEYAVYKRGGIWNKGFYGKDPALFVDFHFEYMLADVDNGN